MPRLPTFHSTVDALDLHGISERVPPSSNVVIVRVPPVAQFNGLLAKGGVFILVRNWFLTKAKQHEVPIPAEFVDHTLRVNELNSSWHIFTCANAPPEEWLAQFTASVAAFVSSVNEARKKEYPIDITYF